MNGRVYPAHLYGSLIPKVPAYHNLQHSIARRGGNDFTYHLKTINPESPNNNGLRHPQPYFHEMRDHIRFLRDALAGEACIHRDWTEEPTFDKTGPQHFYHPPLPLPLFHEINSGLQAMEPTMVTLGKDIELNSFRLQRKDPRAVDELALAIRRQEAYDQWLPWLQEKVAQVKAYWKTQWRKSGAML